MTAPKRRVGNPLGDSRISNEEEAFWAEAHHFSKRLLATAEKMVAYTEGRGSAPVALDAYTQAMRAWQAQETALCIRRGRRIERDLTK